MISNPLQVTEQEASHVDFINNREGFCISYTKFYAKFCFFFLFRDLSNNQLQTMDWTVLQAAPALKKL